MDIGTQKSFFKYVPLSQGVNRTPHLTRREDLPLSIRERLSLSQCESGSSSLNTRETLPSLNTREGWDGSVTFCSLAALWVTAGGRNP